MEIDPKSIESLGDGCLLMAEDGTLILTNYVWWILQIEDPSQLVSGHLLAMLEDGARIDWRALTLQELDADRDEFLPERGTGFLPLRYQSVAPSHSADRLVGLLDLLDSSPAEYTDLTEMKASGKARALHEINGNKPALETTLTAYLYRYKGRVLALNGAQVNLAEGLGMTIYGPDRLLDGHNIPLTRLCGRGIRGVMAPLGKAGITETDDGDELLVDASEASWMDPEEAVTRLTSVDSYRQGNCLSDALSVNYSARLGVSSLLWAGAPYEEIEQEYEAGRVAAYVDMADDLRVSLAKHIGVLENPECPSWAAASAVRSISGIREKFARLLEVCDVSVGPLEYAVSLAEEESCVLRR